MTQQEITRKRIAKNRSLQSNIRSWTPKRQNTPPPPPPHHRHQLPSPSIPSTPKELLGHRGSDSSPFWTLKIATGRADVEEDDNATILRTRAAIISQNREAHPTTDQQKTRLYVKYLQGTKLRLPLPSHSRASFGPLRSPAHPVLRSHSATGKLLGPVARSSSNLKVPPYPRRPQYVQYH
jgi:hypothetical protein